MTSSLRKVVCVFRIKFPTKRIFRIFPILRTDGMAPFGTYLWNDPRIYVCVCNITFVFSRAYLLVRHRLGIGYWWNSSYCVWQCHSGKNSRHVCSA